MLRCWRTPSDGSRLASAEHRGHARRAHHVALALGEPRDEAFDEHRVVEQGGDGTARLEAQADAQRALDVGQRHLVAGGVRGDLLEMEDE